MRFLDRRLKRNLLIVLGVFVLAFIVLLIFNSGGDKKLNYAEMEQTLADAAESYLKKTELLPKENGQSVTVSSEVLISNKYMKSFDKMTKDKNCFGQVIVEKNGENYNSIPNLSCDNYKTKTFKTEISSNLAQDGEDGIYLINNEYVYRGERPNNYFKMGDNTWRIIKMTEDGYLKLIKTTPEEYDYIWDNRYNIVTEGYTGINEFEKSRMSETLYYLYSNSKNFGRIYIVPRHICVGEREYTDFSLNSNKECDVKSKDLEFIDLINTKDLANASLDENCKQTNSPSCNNYNYFKKFFSGSWSLIREKDTTSGIYYYKVASRKTVRTDEEQQIYLVIYLNANNAIKKGTGTSSDPYSI